MNPKTPEPITVEHARGIPWPSGDTHKHNRGRLAIIAGGPLETGAARLAARAGQRMGAGWVTLFGSAAACAIMAHHETSILISQRDEQATLSAQLEKFDAAVIGPAFGLDHQCGREVAELIENFVGQIVLDADALFHIGRSREVTFDALKGRPKPAILTPHGGEFMALFGPFDADNKATATLMAARESGAIIVHKGAETILATPDGDISTFTSNAPFLAIAGTGDVLAGMIGGLLAQGMTGLAACQAAIWLHGETGRRIGPGLIAEDLILRLPPILKELLAHKNIRTR